MKEVIPINGIIARLALNENLTEEHARKIVTDFFDTIQAALVKDGTVTVKGLGAFKVIDNNVAFEPDEVFARAANEPFEMFSPLTLDNNFDLSLIEEEKEVSSGPDVPSSETHAEGFIIDEIRETVSESPSSSSRQEELAAEENDITTEPETETNDNSDTREEIPVEVILGEDLEQSKEGQQEGIIPGQTDIAIDSVETDNAVKSKPGPPPFNAAVFAQTPHFATNEVQAPPYEISDDSTDDYSEEEEPSQRHHTVLWCVISVIVGIILGIVIGYMTKDHISSILDHTLTRDTPAAVIKG